MVDYLKIKLKNQYGLNVIIGSQKYFDNTHLSYEIRNPEVVSNDIIKSSIDDSIIVNNLDLLAKSIYYFYNNTNPVTSVLIEKFRDSTLKILVKEILIRLPFLKGFKITHIEYGFNLENSVTRAKIELTTKSLFKDCRLKESSYTHRGFTENRINSKSICSDFSVNIVLSNQIKTQLDLWQQ